MMKPIRSLNTLIVGSGAAGFNAAVRLKQYGVSDVAILTEGVNAGTSRNTGSDKQTYYKMNLCADYPDSPRAMAEDLFAGRCVDGDNAYAEAALSVPCFIHLAEIGVPFPVNRYGEYVGYKTDHDPRARATSVGPLTSKFMTERLEAEAARLGVRIFDGYLAVSVIKSGERAVGLLTLDLNDLANDDPFVLFQAENIVWATGGPAGMYEDTVYPIGHAGSSGVAFEAGVRGQNLTEWQYGLASVAPRWNVSGTYMQVLPRFVSVGPDGDEREFLADYFSDVPACLSKVFRKGYEWPFDSRKAKNGSSIIDLLVWRECALRGRRVYLDFRRNPFGLDELPFADLDKEAREYLENANACFGTPIERLTHMNMPAIELYRGKGVDLETEMLEIALCAQHNNGGIGVDLWWQSDVPHLFAAGEVAGTHGVYRPGGSALNAGQVGSMRAAQYIAAHYAENTVTAEEFLRAASPVYHRFLDLNAKIRAGGDTATALLTETRRRMNEVAGAIRSADRLEDGIKKTEELLSAFADRVSVADPASLPDAYRLRDALIAQKTYMTAMLDYIRAGGKSRGSALYATDDGEAPDGLDEAIFRFLPDDGAMDGEVREYYYGETVRVNVRPVRPLPEGGGFFENVWREYRENKNIY